MDCLVPRIRLLGLVPLHENLPPLPFREERQLGQTPARIGHDLFEQGAPIQQQTIDRRRVEELGVVVEPNGQVLGLVGHFEM